jgi:hypothetical protein
VTEQVASKETAPEGKMPDGKRHSWWRDAAYITALGSLVIAGATYLKTHLDSKRLEMEVELQKEKQLHTLRQEYLDRAVDPQRNIDYRISVLNFLVVSFGQGDPMGQWASGELSRLQAQVKEAQQTQSTTRRPTNREPRSTREKPPREPDGVVEESQIPSVLPQDVCCIPCNGITICGKTVTTECGSCSAG